MCKNSITDGVDKVNRLLNTNNRSRNVQASNQNKAVQVIPTSTPKPTATFTRQPTKMFNGYAAEVANLYQGMDLRKFY